MACGRSARTAIFRIELANIFRCQVAVFGDRRVALLPWYCHLVPNTNVLM
jgi:hypothetical protein